MFVNIIYNIFCIILYYVKKKRYKNYITHGSREKYGSLEKCIQDTDLKQVGESDGITEEKLEEWIVFQVYISISMYVYI